MRIQKPHLWIAAFSALAVLLVALVDIERTSPGPLSAVHGRVDDLSGKGNCSACHGGFFQSMTDACFECHAPIQEQIDRREGLHGVLGKERVNRCALCHSEHHGEAFSMVNKQSFAQAGVPDPETFDHELVGFAMEGKHLELDCTKCHEHAREPVLPEGARRFIGLDQDCATCHADVHEGRFELACAQCHGQQAFDELFSIDHERQLPLVGGHGDVACRACHAEGSTHALEVLGGRGDKPDPRTCLECHASPHASAFADGVAEIAAMPVDASCVVCHEAEHDTFRAVLEISAEQHARSGFPLEAPHAETTCSECHASELETFPARYPGRRAEACEACHDDPHGGQFAEGLFAGKGCIACHERAGFEPHAFTVEKHATTALALTGSHLETECAECHSIPEDGGPRTFHGTASRCEGCHADAHAGSFDRFAEQLARETDGTCAQCHATTTFDDLAGRPFDHARWTRFAIAGAHAQGTCESCHLPRPERDAQGRIFGRVEEHFGEYGGCFTCHEDPHEGWFDARGAPATWVGRSDCARCHVETSFRAFPEGFDHGKWTGYPLAGAHAEIGCAECHARMRTPDAAGRTWARARGTACVDCHTDPHAGQFKVAGKTDCARCHTSSARFLLTFDHDRNSRFPLSEPHAALDCGACHLPWAAANGVQVVRYKPLSTECSDCHGAQEDVLLRRKGKKK